MLLELFDICAVLGLASKQRHGQLVGGSALHLLHACSHAETITDVVDIAYRITGCGTLDIAHPGEIEHKNLLLITQRLRTPLSSTCPGSILTRLDRSAIDAQIFLRAGQMAELDKIRTELLNRSAITLQRHARGFVKRSQYQRKRHAVITLQACLCIPMHPSSCLARLISRITWEAELDVSHCWGMS